MSFLETIIGWISPSSAAKETSSGVAARRRGKKSFVPAEMAAAPACTVAVACFDGPKGADVSNKLNSLLSDREFLKLRTLNKRLKTSASLPRADRLKEAVEKGREWLEETDADILLWGNTDFDADCGPSVRCRFLTRCPDVEGRPGGFAADDDLYIPLDSTTAVVDILCAAVLAAATPTKVGSRRYPAEILSAEMDKLVGMIASPPPELSNDHVVSVLIVIGNACSTIWRLLGDAGALDHAVLAYQAALDKTSPGDNPLTWARAENHLAFTLEVIGESRRDVSSLEKSVEAYKSAITMLNRTTHANDWALAHVRLGMAFYKMGAISGRARNFKDSVTAFEAAHQVFSRAVMPVQWSEVMNHLGVAHMGLGEQVGGTDSLEQSLACFRAALEVRGREATPLLWAQTANNLGAAAFALSKRNGDTALMNEASRCFEGASEVYNELGKPKLAGVISKNMFRVQRLLETRRSNI